jgi:hypothetical protein
VRSADGRAGVCVCGVDSDSLVLNQAMAADAVRRDRAGCQDGAVVRLPAGWSRPVKPSEVADLFPMAGSVVWNGPPQTVRRAAGQPVVWLTWSAISAQPQPVLTLWAVPSGSRQAIRRWVRSVVAEQAVTWFAATVNADDVSRASNHSRQWTWTANLPTP